MIQLRHHDYVLELRHTFRLARGDSDTRRVLMVEIEHDGLIGRGEAAPIARYGQDTASAHVVSGTDLETLMRRARAVQSGDRDRIRAALAEAGDDPALLPHALEQLDRFDASPEILEYLAAVAPRCVGALTDALLDADTPVLYAEFAVDASNTALFGLKVLTPGAYYTSASGTEFPEIVPEPSICSVLTVGLCVLLRRRRCC